MGSGGRSERPFRLRLSLALHDVCQDPEYTILTSINLLSSPRPPEHAKPYDEGRAMTSTGRFQA